MSICRYARIGQPYGFYNEYRHDAESASDVYMYKHVHGFIACQECKLGGSQDHEPGSTVPFVKLTSYGEAHKHLLAHKTAGHAVPQFAINSTKANADAGEKLEPCLCDVPGCSKLWSHGYPTRINGINGYSDRCDKHYNAEEAKAYNDWLTSEHRRLGKIP